MRTVDGRQEYNRGDLVRVTGANGAATRGGYSWIQRKESAIDHIFEINMAYTAYDEFLDRQINIYTLLPSSVDGTAPPTNNGRPYHWVSEWLEPVSEEQLNPVSNEDFDTLF